MRFLVTGSRDWPLEYTHLIKSKLVNLNEEYLLIQGYAEGADKLAFRVWVEDLERDSVCVPARWKKQGKPAGPIRNRRMANQWEPDFALAFFKSVEKSKGTKDMTKYLANSDVPVKAWKLRDSKLVGLSEADWKFILS